MARKRPKKRTSHDVNIDSLIHEPITIPEREEIQQYILDEKNGICYGVNMRGTLGVVYAGQRKVSQGYHFRFKDYPFYRLVYTVSGALRVHHNKRPYNAESGTIVSFEPGESYKITSLSTEPWVYMYIHFTGLKAAKIYKEARLTSEHVAILHEPLEIQQIFENIVFASLRQNEHSQTICDSYLRILLSRLSELDLEHSPHSNASKITYLQCRNYINENFSGLTNIGQVAEKFYINKVHLCRLFKQYATTSPMAYILQLKVNRAAVLLVQTDCAIKEISFMLNFQDPYYFSKVFKKAYGVSPIIYRKHRGKSNSPPSSPIL